jgi:hypothetical protein
MSTSHNTKPSSSKKPAQQAKKKQQQTQVRPLSPLALVGAIAAALLIAAVLLFVINSRVAAKPVPVVAITPTTAVVGAPAPTQPASSGVTQLGGFARGSPQAKVTVTEYGDFK